MKFKLGSTSSHSFTPPLKPSKGSRVAELLETTKCNMIAHSCNGKTKTENKYGGDRQRKQTNELDTNLKAMD